MQKTSATVFSQRYDYIKGKDAWRNNVRTTTSAVERVRSCLGPNGAYKMVAYSRGPEKIVKITKDAATVLQELAIQYPTVVIISEAAKMHRQEVGDGVACFAIFTSALLRRADELIVKGVHPTTILDGYSEAEKKALEIIEAASEKLGEDAFEKILETADCNKSFLTGEMRGMLIEASEHAARNGKMDKDKIRIIRKLGGTTSESRLIRGLVLKKDKAHVGMPDAVEKPRIAVSSGRIGSNRVEIKMPSEGPFHMKFEMCQAGDLADCRDAEKKYRLETIEKMRSLGVNVFFCQQPIDDFSKSKLREMGILGFETVDKKDCDAIAEATGARVVGNIADLSERDLGRAEKLEIEKLLLEKMTTLTGCDAVTFLITGSTIQALDELELAIRNSLTLLKIARENPRFLWGGGAVETHVARQLQAFSRQFAGKEQLAIECFADALLDIPRCLAENNGLNPLDVMTELGKLHSEGSSHYGVGLDGCCSDVCVELSDVKTAIIKRAYEVALLMLRIDEQVVSKEMLKFHKQ